MKKTYLIAISAAISTGMWAQGGAASALQPKNVKARMTVSEEATVITPAQSIAQRSPNAIIWSEDFGTTTMGGIPTGWTPGGSDPIWRKTAKGSSGFYTGATPVVLNSTTKTNGFLIFDADSLNYYLHPSPPTGYEGFDGSITSDTIDCTGHPNVRLEMQQVFRLCCAAATSNVFVSVSGNGGSTWTDFSVRGTTGINAVATNPTLISLNISAVAGNAAQVLVKLNFTSESGTYYWQVDDMAVVDGAVNEMVLEKTYSDFNYEDGGYYAQTPILQAGPITFRGAILNDGSAAQTNVALNVGITGAGTYSQTSTALATLAPLGRDTLFVTSTPFTPTSQGTYTSVFTVNQTQTDDNASNNSLTRTFIVTDTIYARDLGVTTTGVRNISTNQYIGGDVDESIIANLYEFPAETNIKSASAFIATATALGTSFDFVLYSIDATGNISAAPVANSDIYTISTAADRNKWVTLPFVNGAYPVLANESYYIGIRCYGQVAGTTSLFVLSDLALEQLNGPQTTLVNFSAGDPAQWGLIGASSPFIRLNVDGPVGIEEMASQNGIVLYQNVPNPTSEITTINFEIAKSNKVSLAIYDVTGKLVASIDRGSLAAGSHSISINAKTLEAGMYFYTLYVGDNKLTKKMMVK
jgi:hypothetical protein